MSESQLTITVPPELVEQVAQRGAALFRTQQDAEADRASPWLTFEQARVYLGFSRDALYKLTAATPIPCRKQGRRAKAALPPRRARRIDGNPIMNKSGPLTNRIRAAGFRRRAFSHIGLTK